MADNMVLRGFSGRVRDLHRRMRFCHPILSASDYGTDLLVATDIQWRSNGAGLESVNEDEISSFGTLWLGGPRYVGPGVGVALIGYEFMREVSAALGSAEAKHLQFEQNDELKCWFAIISRAEFDECANRLAMSSRTVFDSELLRCATETDKLSKTGSSALFVLRRAPGRRESDVAIRELAAALVQSEHDLYRRLLVVLSSKLGMAEDTLDRKAKRHLELVRFSVFVSGLYSPDNQLVHKLKSTPLGFKSSFREHERSSSGDSLKEFRTYVSNMYVAVARTASSSEKVVHHTIVRSPLLMNTYSSGASIGQIGSEFEERTYGRNWKQTQHA